MAIITGLICLAVVWVLVLVDSEQRKFLPGCTAHGANQKLVPFDVRRNAMEVKDVGAFGRENGCSMTCLHAL